MGVVKPSRMQLDDNGTWTKQAPSLLFVNPSMGTRQYEREDRLRSYLSLGTMASALREKSFLQRFAFRTRRSEFVLKKKSDYPSFDVKVINLSLKPNHQSIHEYLIEFLRQNGIEPIMICATATSMQLDEANEVAKAAKDIVPRALRVIGGPHVSVLPVEYLKHSEYQVACFGEGVETLTQMVFSYNSLRNGGLSDIPGIVYKDETGTVRVNAPRENIFALDEYPFPSDSIDLFLDDLEDTANNNRDLVYVYAGFGCPYRCVFCAQHAIHKGKIRERSAENVFEEMKKLWGKGFHRFALVQETFLINRERINRFCDLIESSGLKFEWTLEARADQLDLALLRRMKDAGLKFIQIGMETGDQELLDRVGKKMRIEHMKKVRNWCKQLKIDTTFYMLVGLPGQHWQSILRSAVFLRDYTPYNRITKHVPVSIAIPYPGTKIAEDGSVRLVAFEGKTLNWPDRNPEITVNQEGEFAGKSFTKTDNMTSEEILEALIYLEHFGQFHLHAKYDISLTYTDAAKAGDCANRMLYMMERRVIRDLIIRAQESLTPDARQRAYEEILERDAGVETHFKDVTELPEPRFSSFTDFLTTASFTNGFDTMKCLSIPNRIKWMKLCSVIWELAAREFNEFRFEEDREAVGRGLDGLLEGLSVHALNSFLERLDNGAVKRAHFEEFVTEGHMMKAFGLEFRFVHGEKSLIIRSKNSPA